MTIISDLYETNLRIKNENYTPNINANTVVVVKLVDFNKQAVTGKEVTLTVDKGYFTASYGEDTISYTGTNTKTITNNTDSEGEVEVSYVASSGGLVTFTCNNMKMVISVDSITKTEMYPVGSIYMSVNNTSPQTLFGGTWEQIAQGRTIIGQGTGTDSNSVSKTFTNGDTGGEYNHTLTTSEMPKHKHQTGSRQTYGSGSAGGLTTYGSSASTQNKNTSETGSGNAHNNIQPYFVCYIWKRTA